MTKCHLLLYAAAVLSISSCCDRQGGKSLADYSQNSEAGQIRNFEQYAISLFNSTPAEARAAQMKRLSESSSDSTSWRKLLEMERHFFFDPNSPYRCEDYYLPVFEAIAASPFSSEGERSEALYNIPLFSLNPLGERVSDFTYTLQNGRTGTLKSVSGEFILLFFSNPGCENCKQVMDRMAASGLYHKMVEEGTLKVVNIYPDDDIESWFEYVTTYPEEWISGFAPEVDEPGGDGIPLYNLRAIPTLYLLDRDRRLLLKDASIEMILSFLDSKLS